MTKRMVAVVAFEDGGDNVHWFPFVVLEYDDKVDGTKLSDAIYRGLKRQNVLEYDDEYDDYAAYEAGVTEPKIEAELKRLGFDVRVLPTEGMTYIAPLDA